MGSSYFANPVVFLIDTIFALYILAVMLRFLLQWVNADFYNPISQFLVKITHPPLKVLRRFVPSIGRIDTASIVLMLALQMTAGFLIFTMQGAATPIAALFVWALAELIEILINLYVFAILIQVILSWVNPGTYNPGISLIYNLTEPMLRVVRNILPPMGGIDLSPLFVLIGLQLIKMLLIPPLVDAVKILSAV